MDRLIKDAMRLDNTFKVATKTTGKGKKANKELAYSYADVVKAIHIVQTEMGITGTTAQEAEKTISGSLGMVKAAWQNLITAMGEGNEDKLDQMIDQLVYSAEKAAENLMPVIEKAIYGITHLLEALAPVLADKLPVILEKILPSLTKATATLVVAFTNALVANAPVIVAGVGQILKAVFDAVAKEAPGLIPILLGVGAVKTAGFVTGIKDLLVKLGLLQAGGTAASSALAGAGSAAAGAGGAAGGAAAGFLSLTNVLYGLATAGLAAGDAVLVAYDVNKLKEAYEGYKEAGDAHMREREMAIENYRKLYKEQGLKIANEWATTVYGLEHTSHNARRVERMILDKIEEDWRGTPQTLWEGFKQGWDYYFGANGAGIMQLLNDGILGPIMRTVQGAFSWGKDLFNNFLSGLKQGWNTVKSWFTGALNWLKSRIHFSEPDEGPLKDFHTYAPDMMKLFAEGIEGNRGLITKAVDKSFNIAPGINGMAAGGMEYSVPRANGGGNQSAVMECDRVVFARLIYRLYNEEAARVGVQLTGVTL